MRDQSQDQEAFIPKNKSINAEIKEEQEDEAFSLDLIKMTVFELVGTFFFMIVIYFSGADVAKFVFGFWVILSLFAPFSGAHVNPAITLGCYIYECRWVNGLPKLFLYWLAQFIGAFLGVLLSRGIWGSEKIVYVGVPTNEGAGIVFFSETFFTGTFCFVILFVCSKITSPFKQGPLNCALIVSWFYIICRAGSGLSGAAYNPAILTALNVVASVSKDPDATHYLLLMILGELVGVCIFAAIFKWVFENYFEGKYGKKKE